MIDQLDTIVSDFAAGIMAADIRRPQKPPYKPGIGPHPETETVQLVMRELVVAKGETYSNHRTQVPYPDSRQKCDLCLGTAPDWNWAAEIKMIRFFGDNGKPADVSVTHILSPYQSDRSAFTDCGKLALSRLHGRKAVLMYGFNHPERELDPIIDAFEVLARTRVHLSPRCEAHFADLIHPVFQSGRVFGWEVTSKS